MSSSLASRDSDTGNQYFYSRKEKSLGVLCSNFLSLYNREGIESIGLDHAASRLGVERRRIYDIVNILESVGVLAKKAKNQYSWKGFGAMPRALDQLKEEGLRENFNVSDCCNSANGSNENEDGGSFNRKTEMQGNSSASSKHDNRREKSLGLLTQNFVKLFLCSDVDLISLDNAAVTLLSDAHNSTAMRAAKVRRLYDIANVLSSMNLLEKTHHPESRKPAFRWLGMKGNPKNRSDAALDLNNSKKRLFGTEITNISSKRSKVDSSNDYKLKQKIDTPMHTKHGDIENDDDRNELKQQSKHSSKGFVYGPFTPVNVSKVRDSEYSSVKQVQDWESLASTYRPQYRNQVLNDIFAHYMEAWKSWYFEVPGKKQIHQIS